jgi:hypothetical protein
MSEHTPKRIAYADPPYIGCSDKYKNHPDYAGEVDHSELLKTLTTEYDGFILHLSSVSLRTILPMTPTSSRVMAWVKPFCAFKRNVSVAYAWEPVIIQAVRKPIIRGRVVMRDFISENITMKRGLTGAKPVNLIRWAFEMVGAEPIDTLVDLFPGTGVVKDTWDLWADENWEV